MTPRTPGVLLVVLLLGWFSMSSPFGAETTGKPTNRQGGKRAPSSTDARQDQQQRALELLPLLAERIDALKFPAWRFRLKGYVAGLLASSNPEGARQLFQQSLQGLESAPIRSPNKPPNAGEIALFQGPPGADEIFAWEVNSLRSELLALAAAMDRPYAETLVNNLARAATSDEADTEAVARSKSRIVGAVGLTLAKDQPELAARWVENNLAAGVSRFTFLTLETLRHQNPQLADATFIMALSFLESDPETSSLSLMALGSYLFPNMTPLLMIVGGSADQRDLEMGGFDLTGMQASRRNGATAEPDPEMVSRYLNLAYDRYMSSLSALSLGPVTADNPALQSVMANLPMAAMLRSLLSKHLPEKAASLQTRFDEFGKYFANEDGSTLEKALDLLTSMSDPEKPVQWEADATPENQDSRNYQRAMIAIDKGQAAEAQAIMEKLKSDGMKANLRLALISQQIKEAINQGQLDTASALARTLADPSRQTSFLLQIGELHTKRKEPEPALLCLAEAEQLLDKLRGLSQLNFAVEIVEKLAKLDPERAYASAARLVERMNRTGVSQTGSSPYQSPDLMIANNLLRNSAFSFLAAADFDAALALAQSIARPEAAIAAQLAVCRSALTSPGPSSDRN